ncbi:lipopolysaccharide biosynthesis protein [Glycocaulis abyssi]|uniref:Lipopolysaccharide biosynthesis protein n=1 Tax=Glycocaulis abyssi TaxID=1433403 RepID=A0ABV9NG06_9PROT
MHDTGNTPGQHTPNGGRLRVLWVYLQTAMRSPKAARIAGLTVLRGLAAVGSLISVAAIVRLFPVDAAGEFFVFLAAAQFVAGAALGPLLMLAIRFGSVHKADGDREALGRLILFGAAAIALLAGIVWLAHPLASDLSGMALGEAWVFAVVAALSGAMIFLGGLARVNGKVIAAIVPENVLRPAGLAIAALALWFAGLAVFPALSAAYGAVLLAVCAVLAAMGPWRAARFTRSGLAAYRPYFKAYGPLLAYGLVSTALSTFDILVVSHAVAVEAVPAYKAALQYATLLTTGVIFANLIYGPQIAIAHQRGDLPALQRLARSSSRLALGFYALAFAPLLTGPWLFELAFGAVGREAWLLALILCAGRFVNAWFGSVTNLANLTGRTTLVALMQGAGVVILLLLGPVLAAQFGSTGVAIASTLALTGWVVATSLILQRSLKLKMGPI